MTYTPFKTIPTVVDQTPAEFDEDARHWKLALFNEDGSPFSSSPENSSAEDIAFTPDGGLVATNVQSAVVEVAEEAADAKERTNHTGTQTSATIADFTEAVQDAVATLLGAGSNVTLNYNDVLDTLTITTADTDTTNPEAVRDAIGVALVAVGLIGISVNDGADTITISTTATANATDAQLRDRSLHTGTQTIATIIGLQTALDLKTDETTRSASGKGFVNHAAVAGTARPTGYASIEWLGSVEPTNAVNGDSWVNTT